MAHIKCRYTKLMCSYEHAVEMGDEYECERWSCCDDYQKPERRVSDDGYILAEDACSHSYTIDIEFEKAYKEYEYDASDGLSLGRRKRFIPSGNIEYLEIDGRVLIEEET